MTLTEGEPNHLPHDPLAGHLYHLTSAQEAALATFQDILTKASLYTPLTDTSPPSHDEATLLRFLRARGFDPVHAQKQFSDAEAWRKQYAVDKLYTSFDAEEIESFKRFYPRWTGRRDKQGHPLYVYRLASLEPLQKELDAVPAENRYQRLIVLYEIMLRFTFQLCSFVPHPSQKTPITSSTSIIDLEQVSFTSMWRLRNHLQESSRLATANYPETLNTITVVNSPSFFPTIWGWIKGWFDEGTRKKIYILGKDPGPQLLEIIDAEDLPKSYGGQLDWKFEDEPSLDEDAKNVLGEMPKGSVIFANGVVSNVKSDLE